MAELKFVGIAVGTNIRGSRWEDHHLWDILEAAEGLDAIVFLHPSIPAGYPLPGSYYLGNIFGNPADTTVALQSLTFSGALEHFPRLKLVLAHGGGYLALSIGRMEHAWRVREETKRHSSLTPREALRSVCVDTVVHSPAALRFIVDVFGKDNVVFGTDFPADMGLPDPVNFVSDALGANSGATRAVLHEYVHRLLGPIEGGVPAAV